jgi:hypothetical protein
VSISLIEQCQLDVLDTLLNNGGSWATDDGTTLVTLARTAHGDDDIEVGDMKYHRTSAAVLRLEAHGLVRVDRRYQDEHAKANIVERVEVL